MKQFIFSLLLGGVIATLCKPLPAAPAPATNTSEMIAQADTVLVGKVISLEHESGPDGSIVTLRAQRRLKGQAAVGSTVRFAVAGSPQTDVGPGAIGLFMLNCPAIADSVCLPVATHRPGFPAVERATRALPGQHAFSVEGSAAAELVGVIAASDATLGACSSDRLLDTEGAAWIRVEAIRALGTLNADAARFALAGAGKPAFLPARLALLTAQGTLADYSGLEDVQDVMQSGDSALVLARHELAYALMRDQHPPEALVPIMASWLKSKDPEIRLTAAYVMRHIAAPGVIRPLLEIGLADPSAETRYYAATGLAAATGENSEYVASDIYRASEAKHLAYWTRRKAELLATH